MLNPSSSSKSDKRQCCSMLGQNSGRYWTPKEDKILSDYIRKHGEGHWPKVAKNSGLHRCSNSCRFRWMNYLSPSVKLGKIAPVEEDLILRLHPILGNRWSKIAQYLPGRTDNEIKNYWNTHLSKKLIRQGIDPRTHKPLNQDSSAADDHAKASSSSKPKETPALTEENPSGNKENRYFEFQTTNLDQYQAAGTTVENLANSGNMGLGSNNEGKNEINHCSDDEFWEGLERLMDVDLDIPMINEEAAVTPQHQLHQPCIEYCLWGCTQGSCDHAFWF